MLTIRTFFFSELANTEKDDEETSENEANAGPGTLNDDTKEEENEEKEDREETEREGERNWEMRQRPRAQDEDGTEKRVDAAAMAPAEVGSGWGG